MTTHHVMLCRSCGWSTKNSIEKGLDKFCPSCGESLIHKCPECDQALRYEGASVCSLCGARLIEPEKGGDS